MIYNILKTTDLFKNDLRFRINRQDQVSTVETIICSILFYVCASGICIFTFIQSYNNEVPKIATRELVRDVNTFESIQKHKLDLIVGSYYFNPLRGTISLLSHQNETFFETTSKLDFREVTYFPNFIYKETLAAKMQNCSEEIYDRNRLISNAKCFEFQNNTYDFGGSVFSTGIEKNMRSRFDVDLCEMKEVYNTGMSRLFPNSTINELIKSYNHKNICDVINVNSAIENTIIVSILYSTDLLDIYDNKGFQTHFLSTYNNFAYQRFELVVDVLITKCSIETDFNRLYPIDPKIKNTYFEKDIKFTLREKKNRDNKLYVEINYNINNVIKTTDRSYVKFDEVLASAFALIEVAFLFIGYSAKWLSYNCVEYDLIKHLYYETPSNIISYKGFKDFSSSGSRNSSISKGSIDDQNNDQNEIVRIEKVEENIAKNEKNRNSLIDQNKNTNNPFRQSLSTPISKFPKYYRGSVNPNNLSHGIIIVDEFNHAVSRKTLKRNGLENEREINSNNGGRNLNENVRENEMMINNMSNHVGPPKIVNRESISNSNLELKNKLAISDELEYNSNTNLRKNEVIVDDQVNDVVEINEEKNKDSRQSSFINSKSEISENSNNPIYDSITHPKNFGNFHIDEGAHRLDFYSGFLTCLKTTFGCFLFKKSRKNLIEREKVLQVLHRDLDIVIILKKLIECEFLTKNFYEQKFGKKNRRRSSFVYDNAFFYTNRNVNNPEDIFFTMDFKYFGSEVALFQKVDRRKTFKSLESMK